MKYINAAELLPEKLLLEIQNYISGELIYIPNAYQKTQWGEKSGSRKYYTERNSIIKEQYKNGKTMEQIAKDFGLAYDTIRKIVYN